MIITDLQKNGYRGTGNGNELVIADSTLAIADSHILFSISSTDIAFIKSKFKKFKRSTLDDFWNENKKVISLRNHVRLKKNQLFENDVNTADRFVKLSNVGFDKQCDQALITYFYFCGETCGNQKFTILQKEDRRWKIKNEIITAES